MSNPHAFGPRFYSTTNVEGSGTAHLGDRFEYGTTYNFQRSEFHYHNAPQGASTLSPTRSIIASQEHAEDTGKGLALLSFDSGVIGGLAGLYSLREFMQKVAPLQGRDVPLKPCEFFDLIAGAGVGGLIAILLGCLELGIDECIEKYLFISRKVFGTVTDVNSFAAAEGHEPALLDWEDLGLAMKKVLQGLGKDEGSLFAAPAAVSCKVFVIVSGKGELSQNVMRSYKVPDQSDQRLKYLRIWQAACATLATTGLFKPIVVNVGDAKEQFGSTANFLNSPIDYLWREARAALLDKGQKLEDHLDCIISVANMVTARNRRTGFCGEVFTVMSKIAHGAEQSNHLFLENHSQLKTAGRFCRLLCALELEGDSIQEHLEHAKIKTSVEQYFQSASVQNQLTPCIRNAAKHQAVVGFALIRSSSNPLSFRASGRDTVSLPELISSYDARTTHWLRSVSRVSDTCTWIFSESNFIKWRQAPGTSVLSCVGTVGCGKSFLAAAVIDHVKELRLGSNHGCIHYFIETGHASKASFDHLVRALIKQSLLLSQQAMLPFPSWLEDELLCAFGPGSYAPPTDHLILLLKKAVDVSPRSLYLIDGFDDLHEEHILQLFRLLRTVFGPDNVHGSKLALFSREMLGRGIELRRQLATLPVFCEVRLSLANLSGDISRFVEAQIFEQQLARTITTDEELLKDIKKKLISHSGKMFLWIRFQILSIWNTKLSKCDDDIRDLIHNLPAGLEETYVRCLRRIEEHENDHDRKVVMRAFRWVAGAKHPLSAKQAREAVSMTSDCTQLTESSILPSDVPEYCGNLLTMDLTNRFILFTHASVKQFLQDKHKVPTDLMRYHLDTNVVNEYCAELCLAYLKALRSGKQLIRRHEATISGNVSMPIVRGIPGGSGVWGFTRLFTKRSTAPAFRITIPLPAQPLSLAKLEIHNYVVKFWLAHNVHICEQNTSYDFFTSLCLSPDSGILPWLEEPAVGKNLYRQLMHYAVLEGHLPMFLVVRDHLMRNQKQWAEDLFWSPPIEGLPGHLSHMAAAMGHSQIVAEMKNVCNMAFMSDDGMTPLAWAAKNNHLKTMEYLIGAAPSSVASCIHYKSPIFQEGWMCLMGVLAGQDSSDGFWAFIKIGYSAFKPCLTPRFLSQSLYAACTKGNIEIARQLIDFGAKLDYFTAFTWPGTQKKLDGNPLLVAIDRKDVIAAETLLQIGAELHSSLTESIMAGILSMPGTSALRLLPHFVTATTVDHLRGSLQHEWMKIIASICKPNQLPWRQFVRCVLQLECQNPRPHFDVRRLKICDVMERDVLNTWYVQAPDDILVSLLRNDYVVRIRAGVAEQGAQLNDLLRAFVRRRSPRALSHLLRFPGVLSCLRQPSTDQSHCVRYCFLTASKPCVDILSLSCLRAMGGHAWLDFINAFVIMDNGYKFRVVDVLQEYDVTRFITVRYRLHNNDNVVTLHSYSNCLRSCRGDEGKASALFDRLKYISPDCDMSLNFPAGYWQIGKRYAIKLSVVGAVYRWNWRLRRQKVLPFSAADIAYSKAVSGYPIGPETNVRTE